LLASLGVSGSLSLCLEHIPFLTNTKYSLEIAYLANDFTMLLIISW
jgi:hypothetical protein